MRALSEVKPYVVIAVPLVIEKIYKNKVKPILEKEGVRFLMKVPGVNQVIMNKIKAELINAFGGEFYEVIIGGAAFNKEVETFFKKMGFPFTVGYGMTECAPIITYDDWQVEKLFSCGKATPNMQVRIASADPINIPGEIQVREPMRRRQLRCSQRTAGSVQATWVSSMRTAVSSSRDVQSV